MTITVLSDRKRVVKDDTRLSRLDNEAAIYELLGSHPRLLQYHGRHDKGGLILQHHPKGSLCSYFESGVKASANLRLKWMKQLTEAISYLHLRGVGWINGHPSHVLLSREKHVIISGFEGSGALSLNRAGHRYTPSNYTLPRLCFKHCIKPGDFVAQDIFALGSLLFFLATGGLDPWHDIKASLDEEDFNLTVAEKHKQGFFAPFIDGVPDSMRTIIVDCWEQHYGKASDILVNLHNIEL